MITSCRKTVGLPRLSPILLVAQQLIRAMSAQDSPATIDDLADGGDEVQRRFRYQINYCALKALQLLRPTAEFCAIYCEHIEDLLIESLDGAFIGIQIKTRE